MILQKKFGATGKNHFN